MHTRFWRWLCPVLRFGVPAIIKKYKQRFYMMIRSNCQKRVYPFFKSKRVVCPYKIVQKNTQRIKSYSFGPPQFTIDCRGVKSLRLPHFQLVDGSARQKIATHEPAFLLVPV